MPDIRDDLHGALSDPDPVRRAQIQMHKPLPKRFLQDRQHRACGRRRSRHSS